MANKDIVTTYIDSFCEGRIDDMADLLADNLVFVGPLHAYSDKISYVESLRADPPPPVGHRILSVVEEGEVVSALYEYDNLPGYKMISQLFVMSEGKIAETTIVFDARGFV